ncbi:methyl-accepting chemotaxis protein [Paenibacillus sp. FSL H8-0034]|uniref:methyl-accepting chemotaxis protein n=1 Tax=Paenibacillus sp. FSL H8-0034 TaxID=2954671 RepID=UPI0030F953B3
MKIAAASGGRWLERLFKPSMWLMNRLRYAQKFVLIGLVFVIPIMVLTFQMFYNMNKDVRHTELEARGLVYQRGLGEMIVALEQYGWSLDGGSEGVAVRGDVKEIGGRIDRIINDLIQEMSAPQSGLMDSDSWSNLVKQWETIKAEGGSTSRAFYEVRHVELEQMILKQMDEVTNNSGLILDSEMDTYYLMNAVVNIFPGYWTHLEKIELMGTEIAMRGSIKNVKEREDLIRLTVELDAVLSEMNQSAELVIKQNPRFEMALRDLQAKNAASTKAVTELLDDKLVNAGVIVILADEVTSTSQIAKKALLDLHESQLNLMGERFDERIRDHKVNGLLVALLLLFILVVVIYLFAGFYFSVKNAIVQLDQATQQLVQGDLTVRVSSGTRDEFSNVISAYNLLADSFQDVVGRSRQVAEKAYESAGHLRISVQETAGSSRVITDIMQEVAVGSELQMRSSQDTASAMNEVSLGVQRIAETSSVVANAAGDAAQDARRGSVDLEQAVVQMASIKTKVSETAVTISQLHELSIRIDRILIVIKEISNQTKLLALNASIEAARAGEHGRGFHVVAEEVRKLAEQSDESVKQIASLISRVQHSAKETVDKIGVEIKEVDKGSVLLDQVSVVFGRILKSVEQVASQIQEVSAASEQISANTEEVSASMEDSVGVSRKAVSHAHHVKVSMEKQVGATKEVAMSSEALNVLSEELFQSLVQFRIE